MAGFSGFPNQSGPFDGPGSQSSQCCFFTEESQTIGTDDQPGPTNGHDRTSSAQVDLRFLRRLLAILRLAGAKYAVILLLLALANIPIVAKMGTVTGTFYFALVNGNPDAFLKTLGNSAIWLTLAAVSTALTDWSAQFLCLKWRKTLTSACHVAYRRSSWLYFASLEKRGSSAVHNAATKAKAPSVPVIDNPDQRITEDIHRFAEQVSLLLSRTVTAPLTVLYYSCWVVSLIGPTGLLIILLFFTIGAVITRRVMSPVAALVAEQERREAEFRMAHVRVKERSEDILFSRGGDAEARQLSAELAAVLANQEKLVWRYLKLGITTKVFDYAGVAVNYLALAAPVFGIVGAGISGGGGDSKDKGAVAQWISNASFAILQLIFGGSQIIDAAKIISDSAGYTARVGELFESLQLLPSDRLQSHPEAREFMLQEPTWLMAPIPGGGGGRADGRIQGTADAGGDGRGGRSADETIAVRNSMQSPCCHVSAEGRLHAHAAMHPILQYSIHSVPPELRSLVAALLPQPRGGRGKVETRREAARVGEAWGVSVTVGDVGVEGVEIEEMKVEDVRVEKVRVEDVKIVVTFQCSDADVSRAMNRLLFNSRLFQQQLCEQEGSTALADASPADSATAAHADLSPAGAGAPTQADVSRAMNRLLFNFRLFQQQLCEHIWAAGHWADAVDPLTGYLMHAASRTSGRSSGRAASHSGGVTLENSQKQLCEHIWAAGHWADAVDPLTGYLMHAVIVGHSLVHQSYNCYPPTSKEPLTATMAAVRSLISSVRLTPAAAVPLKSSASSLVRDESRNLNLSVNLAASCSSTKGSRRVAPPSAAATTLAAAAAAPTAEDAPSVAASETKVTTPPRRRLKVGCHAAQGRRDEMEDHVVVLEDIGAGFLYAGVFDGHAGASSAKFLSDELHDDCMEALEGGAVLEDEDLTAAEDALEDAFLKADQRLLQWLEEHSSEPESGSTGTVAFVRHDRLFVAHIGDSRAVMAVGGDEGYISDDHKPSGDSSKAQAEIKRINKAGGWVSQGRVCGVIAVSRAFGNVAFKTRKEEMMQQGVKKGKWTTRWVSKRKYDSDWISALPDVYGTELTEDAEFVIIASDGLWDAFSSSEAVSFVRSEMQKHGDVQQACEALVHAALHDRGTEDNTSVIVISLRD
ncbi:unnamed protein product [Closterium sp. Yama58-4]|nr:unnamed protein product [Closterium sp. Yama58-4]